MGMSALCLQHIIFWIMWMNMLAMLIHRDNYIWAIYDTERKELSHTTDPVSSRTLIPNCALMHL